MAELSEPIPRIRRQTDPPECDFCGDPKPVGVGQPYSQADSWFVYECGTFALRSERWISQGHWLSCSVCHAFISQSDRGDPTSRGNLERRALEKMRRKYGLRGANAAEEASYNRLLLLEIRELHRKFWELRRGEPVPYRA